jgi:pimeloyl-ACP methyl ester carboxylesterase
VEERTLELTSGRIAAAVSGPEDGPLVLCVHGLSANLRAYDAIAPRLSDAGHRVAAIDLRGRGHSDVTPPGSYGLGAHAADVLAVANELGAETFDYVGWSMGALIGILAASLGAGRLRRLVLIDHAGASDPEAGAAVRAGLNRLDLPITDPDEYTDRMRAAGAIEHWHEQWDAMYRRELGRTSRGAAEEDYEDIVARDWTEAWRPLAMPTLLVRATRPLNGGFVVTEAARDGLMATAAQPTLAEVDANHFDVMTDDRTAAAIVEFLA